MKFVIQRVNSASVKVDGNVIGSIGKGYLILFGAGEGDTEDMLVPFADKICKMRIALCRERVAKVETGEFGADMKVSLENDGPFTIVLDSRDFKL